MAHSNRRHVMGLHGLQFWTLLTLVPAWLIAVRAGIEPDYIWGFLSLAGPSHHANFWPVPLLALLGYATIYMGYRGARPPFHIMLVGWHAVLTFAFIRDALSGEPIIIQGDNWGWSFDATLIMPVLLGLGTLAALYWCIHDRVYNKDSTALPASPHRLSKKMSLTGEALLLAEIPLFLHGEQLGTTDGIAVAVTLVQLILLYGALLPRGVLRADNGSKNG